MPHATTTAAFVTSLCLAVPALAQISPLARSQVQDAIGARIETVAILASDRSASGGHYESSDSHPDPEESELDIFRLPALWESKKRYNLFGTDLQYAPILRGGIASTEATRKLQGEFGGDEVSDDSLLVNAGAGARIFLTESLSVAPSLDLIYSYTDNSFSPRSDLGDRVEKSGSLVGWDVHTLTLAPKAELRYTWSAGLLDFAYSLRYSSFDTDTISDPDSEGGDFESSSHVLSNRIEAEAPLGFSIFDYPVRAQASFSALQFWGGIEDILGDDMGYRTTLALITRQSERLPLVNRIGIEGTLFRSAHVDGYSIGITASLDYEKMMALLFGRD